MQLIISENKKLQKGYLQEDVAFDASYERNAQEKKRKRKTYFIHYLK